MNPPPVSAVFLDRDGLINVPPPAEQRYLLHPDEFRLMPGIAEAIRLLNLKKIPVFVVTNQKGVSLGLLSLERLAVLHARMRALLAEHGAAVAEIYVCPHSETENCDCRKPLPGMLLNAAKEHGISLENAWMIGDQPRDVEAGKAAGCHTLLVGAEESSAADLHLDSTRDIPGWIEKTLN